MRIKISTLSEICVRHFESLQDLGYDSLEISRDYYWTIDLEDLYNLYEDPEDFGVGSLVEEWQAMEQILTGEYEPCAVSLQWLAGLFMAVAERLLDPTDIYKERRGKTE